MKIATYFLLLTTIFSCNDKPESYSIDGLTSGITDSTMVYLSEDNQDTDSTYVINNKFKFTGGIDGKYKNLWIHTKGYKEYKSIWIMNASMKFDARNTSFRNAKLTGSRIQDQSNEYESAKAYFNNQMDSIQNVIRKLPEKDSTDKKELKKMYEILSKEKQETQVSFIAKHPDYELSPFFLTFLKNHIDKETTKRLYDGLNDRVKNNDWGRVIVTHIDKSVKLKTGDKAVNFSLPNIHGNEVSLSSFAGRYVLLEFWATGCAPCRLENPNLLKAYNKYKENGFEILGVSLDEKKSHWKSTLKKDSIIWTTVSDLKGHSGVVPTTYSVSYIPKNYLLDKDGIVIAKDLRGNKLQEKLKEVFGE